MTSSSMLELAEEQHVDQYRRGANLAGARVDGVVNVRARRSSKLEDERPA